MAVHAGQADQGGEAVGLSTVCRTLTALAEAGRADVFRDTSGERLFRHCPGPDHRHYPICTERGLSLPVESGPVEKRADRIARTSGFTDVRHARTAAGRQIRHGHPGGQWSSQCPSCWA
ncbi:transcriptional repressor [Streptomyces orinoci]|uniref:Transcriptional repressor n=1 Tax=Streptomyces orinoci TaxID=67339 RepID=A0ABV3JXS8_STRON|nr:transcriptional repressor [Streptomyces orinoci]